MSGFAEAGNGCVRLRQPDDMRARTVGDPFRTTLFAMIETLAGSD
jgi:hypothetical protein